MMIPSSQAGKSPFPIDPRYLQANLESIENYAPFCATLYSVVEGNTYGHYGCAEKKTSAEVMSTSSKDGESRSEPETETEIASFTGLSPSRPTAASTTEEESVSNARQNSTSMGLVTSPSSNVSSGTTREAPTFVQSGISSTTASSAWAERTAEIVVRGGGRSCWSACNATVR